MQRLIQSVAPMRDMFYKRAVNKFLEQQKGLGVELDEEKNSGCREGTISSAASAVRVSVIPANEELGVARQTYGYIEKMEG